LGIFELMLITSKVRELIFKNASSYELRMLGISQGMRTLYIDGLDKVVRGITTLEEVYRSAKRMEGDEFKT
jgi:type IV pilus assembly protein PilB